MPRDFVFVSGARKPSCIKWSSQVTQNTNLINLRCTYNLLMVGHTMMKVTLLMVQSLILVIKFPTIYGRTKEPTLRVTLLQT